jgi:hypothetical protein
LQAFKITEESAVKDWFAEFLVVLSHSKRTQWAIFLGVFGFVAINLWGDYQLSNFELSGHMDSIGAAIKEKLLRCYDKVGLACLISFFLLAIKLNRKDKKRLYAMD